MIEHLSAEQVSQWMIGERTPQLEEHLAQCAACRGELDEMEGALSQFRSAMRDPANSAPPPVWREPSLRADWLAWPRLALAAALIIAVGLPVSREVRAHRQALREQAARAALADSQLLESVDAEISQAVPQPLEPLVTLVTWNSTSVQQNQASQRQ